ncbi:MAG: leucyl/phenylalanyl-tRNA--protein transferase [Burkholderiaceae bacterium]
MAATSPTLPWLQAGQEFPQVELALGQSSPMPGLLAAGGALDVVTLQQAYQKGIFPWFSDGQPILWWSPDPRMVLQVAQFRLHRSLGKTIEKFRITPGCEIRFDSAFSQVIESCANHRRGVRAGTWILPEMQRAYIELHHSGLAHSVEVWEQGQLIGGLYCVALGRAVFGESMFSRRSDASKIALAALVGFCREFQITQIDCQQNTAHLASMGACDMSRHEFLAQLGQGLAQSAPPWHFLPLYWQHLLTATSELP